jgi:hypothetical protein
MDLLQRCAYLQVIDSQSLECRPTTPPQRPLKWTTCMGAATLSVPKVDPAVAQATWPDASGGPGHRSSESAPPRRRSRWTLHKVRRLLQQVGRLLQQVRRSARAILRGASAGSATAAASRRCAPVGPATGQVTTLTAPTVNPRREHQANDAGLGLCRRPARRFGVLAISLDIVSPTGRMSTKPDQAHPHSTSSATAFTLGTAQSDQRMPSSARTRACSAQPS